MAITIGQSGRKITVAIDGEDFTFLERHARAMNACGWADNDNTALTVFENFVWDILAEQFEEKENALQPLAEWISDGIATDNQNLTDAPEPLNSQRRAELREAFRAEGLLKD